VSSGTGTGQAWRSFDLVETSVQRFGAPHWTAHRGDFHAVLLDGVCKADPDAIHAGNACTGFEQDAHRATIRLASGETAAGEVLIAADGVHSAIRQQMFGDGRASFTAIMAWRELVPMERLPEHQRRMVGNTWLGVDGHCVTYPLRRGEILNFVGLIERDDWRVESWTVAGTTEECLRDLAPWHEDVQTIVRNIDTPFQMGATGTRAAGPFRRGPRLRDGRRRASHPAVPRPGG
jgi:salicylate hydroxylase